MNVLYARSFFFSFFLFEVFCVGISPSHETLGSLSSEFESSALDFICQLNLFFGVDIVMTFVPHSNQNPAKIAEKGPFCRCGCKNERRPNAKLSTISELPCNLLMPHQSINHAGLLS